MLTNSEPSVKLNKMHLQLRLHARPQWRAYRASPADFQSPDLVLSRRSRRFVNLMARLLHMNVIWTFTAGTRRP